MTDVQILLDIQRTLGSLESRQVSANEKLNDIHEQVKYTNGRVNKLRSDVDRLLDDDTSKKKDSSSASLNKDQIAVIGLAVSAFAAYIVDKLS